MVAATGEPGDEPEKILDTVRSQVDVRLPSRRQLALLGVSVRLQRCPDGLAILGR